MTSDLRPVAGLAMLVAAAGCAPTYAHVETASLASKDGLRCRGHFVWQDRVDHAFVVMHGTGTRSNAFVPPAFESLIAERPVLFATFDRPGVSAPFGDPDEVTRDPEALEAVTQDHVLACADSAAQWIRERFGAEPALHLRGHSEGALIALRLYERLGLNPTRAQQIRSLILSGTPLEPFDTIVKRQLEDVVAQQDGGAVRDAVASCDWPTMQTALGVSCRYLDDAARQPTGFDAFRALAALRAPARIFVFHGTADWNAPVAPVRELERWAAGGPLHLEVRYYEGGHTGPPPEARRALQAVLQRVTEP
ncbi:MAG: hypothetical protein KC731_13975 [Myxococcales bacterium]|nr:hypothetical protein [Myxococcales bacterium]